MGEPQTLPGWAVPPFSYLPVLVDERLKIAFRDSPFLADLRSDDLSRPEPVSQRQGRDPQRFRRFFLRVQLFRRHRLTPLRRMLQDVPHSRSMPGTPLFARYAFDVQPVGYPAKGKPFRPHRPDSRQYGLFRFVVPERFSLADLAEGRGRVGRVVALLVSERRLRPLRRQIPLELREAGHHRQHHPAHRRTRIEGLPAHVHEVKGHAALIPFGSCLERIDRGPEEPIELESDDVSRLPRGHKIDELPSLGTLAQGDGPGDRFFPKNGDDGKTARDGIGGKTLLLRIEGYAVLRLIQSADPDIQNRRFLPFRLPRHSEPPLSVG